MAKFKGVSMKLGDRDFVIPSLSVNQAETLWPDIMKLGKESKFSDVLPIVHAAISRNYPDVTVSDLGDLLDLASINQVMKIVMGQSGLVDAKTGEEQPAVVIQ